jgi:hypothetical protein
MNDEDSNIQNVERFLGHKLPVELREKYKKHSSFVKLNKNDITKTVDFFDPFLRTEKLVIFGDDIVGSASIGIGTVFIEDLVGHYNNTIYLAFAGRLMPSTATIHLAHFFPNTCPQAVEGKSIRMDKEAMNGGLLQPKKEGTIFYVESIVTKKKLNLVLLETNIMFGQAKFGLIENLKFVLTDKNSIYNAITIPDVA